MKENAPEEIYLLPDDRNPNGLSICWYEAPYCTGAIEYVRKDAFIEKAAGWLEDFCNEHYIMSYSDSHEVETKELIEIFIKKMKGE